MNYKNLNINQVQMYSKQSKKQLLKSLDSMQKTITKLHEDNYIDGGYSIEIYRNDIPVQTISVGIEESFIGTTYNRIKDLTSSLIEVYQDGNSIVKGKIIFQDEWDESTTKK
jgi:hypothetical protein